MDVLPGFDGLGGEPDDLPVAADRLVQLNRAEGELVAGRDHLGNAKLAAIGKNQPRSRAKGSFLAIAT